MKLIAVLCFSLVLYVDSNFGLTIDDFFSHLPVWDTISNTWNQIKEAIKRPVKIRRWGIVNRRKTTTTTTTTEPPSTKAFEITLSTPKETLKTSKSLALTDFKKSTPHLNATSKILRIPFIYLLFSRNSSTFKPDLDTSSELSISITKELTTDKSLVNEESLTTWSTTNLLPTTTLAKHLVYNSLETNLTTLLISSSPIESSTTSTEKSISNNFTLSSDKPSNEPVTLEMENSSEKKINVREYPEVKITVSRNETKVNLPYLPNPEWKNAAQWEKLQAPPFASTKKQEAENATEIETAVDRTAKKGLSEEDDDYSFFGSLVFI